MAEKYDITLKEGLKGAKPRTTKSKRGKVSSWFYLSVAGQIGYVVATPLIIGVLVGYVVDERLGSKPIGTLTGLGIGAILSVLGFWKTIKKLLYD